MARMSSARETAHRHWADTRSHAGSRRLASAHRYSVPGAFHTARSWLKASHTVILRRLAKAAELPRETDDKCRHVRLHSEAATMARNGVHRSILQNIEAVARRIGTVPLAWNFFIKLR